MVGILEVPIVCRKLYLLYLINYSVPETTEDVLATVQQTRKTMVGVGLDKSAQKDCTDIEVKDIDVGVMATDEILTYIQCNTAKEDDLDLF